MRSQEKWSFDIDRAMDTWRQFMSSNPAIRPADLEELEIHLRDEWESLISRGMEPEKAFDEARRDLGDFSELSTSFEEVHFEKVFRKGQARSETHVIKTVLANYIKTAWRSLIRQKGFSTINILGLGLALAAAFVISMFIRHSLSYDQYLERADETYRIGLDRDFPGENSNQSFVTVGLAELIRAEWPGAEVVTQMYGR